MLVHGPNWLELVIFFGLGTQNLGSNKKALNFGAYFEVQDYT